MALTRKRPTALGIPSPWSGDEFEPTNWTYAVWVRVYWKTRVWRHRLGLHDFVNVIALDRDKCTWCGRLR